MGQRTHLRATFAANFDRGGGGGGLSIDLKSYNAKFDTTVISETEFHENNNIFVSQTNTSATEKSCLHWPTYSYRLIALGMHCSIQLF